MLFASELHPKDSSDVGFQGNNEDSATDLDVRLQYLCLNVCDVNFAKKKKNERETLKSRTNKTPFFICIEKNTLLLAVLEGKLTNKKEGKRCKAVTSYCEALKEGRVSS